MIISLHLRPGKNATNFRAECIAEGLAQAGCQIVRRGRSDDPAPNAEIVLQTGFSSSTAIRLAYSEGIPFIVAEAPVYRHIPHVDWLNGWVDYGYGGLMGSAYHTPAPSATMYAPPLKPLRFEGSTIIFAQKPNDHSLRDSDHVAWLTEKLIQHPKAEFRPHPLMTTKPLEPIHVALSNCFEAITYTSTAGVEALIEGCISQPEHPGSAAYAVKDRQRWIHELSWQTVPVTFAATATMGRHILNGFEVARERARTGQQELPRTRKVCAIRYHIDDPRVTAWQ